MLEMITHYAPNTVIGANTSALLEKRSRGLHSTLIIVGKTFRLRPSPLFHQGE
jgi:hypothetical protein